jgi:hypothetical protein
VARASGAARGAAVGVEGNRNLEGAEGRHKLRSRRHAEICKSKQQEKAEISRPGSRNCCNRPLSRRESTTF